MEIFSYLHLFSNSIFKWKKLTKKITQTKCKLEFSQQQTMSLQIPTLSNSTYKNNNNNNNKSKLIYNFVYCALSLLVN